MFDLLILCDSLLSLTMWLVTTANLTDGPWAHAYLACRITGPCLYLIEVT